MAYVSSLNELLAAASFPRGTSALNYCDAILRDVRDLKLTNALMFVGRLLNHMIAQSGLRSLSYAVSRSAQYRCTKIETSTPRLRYETIQTRRRNRHYVAKETHLIRHQRTDTHCLIVQGPSHRKIRFKSRLRILGSSFRRTVKGIQISQSQASHHRPLRIRVFIHVYIGHGPGFETSDKAGLTVIQNELSLVNGKSIDEESK
ncbi:hypothetical protein GGS21DRAFT_487739 [Xylaria nigripes]|nr:hypothetical protein GGS21DRAFT_487739 [Xylaria nigripes]